MRMPATISGTFQGAAQAFQASLQGMGILLVLATSSSTSCSGFSTRASSTR
jgi:hypothetical protein